MWLAHGTCDTGVIKNSVWHSILNGKFSDECEVEVQTEGEANQNENFLLKFKEDWL